MKIQEAFNRLAFTIQKQNKPNQKDVDAFNEIAKFFKLSEEKTIKENLLFAKLYTFILTDYAKHYCDVDFGNKQINKILSEPVELRIKCLQNELKYITAISFFQSKKVLDPFLKEKSFSELQEVYFRYKDKVPALKNSEFPNMETVWDYETVVYNLENQINLSIKNFKNYV